VLGYIKRLHHHMTSSVHPFPYTQVHAQVTLGDPGYIYTSKILVCVVQTLLAERSALLEATGTAGGAFTVGELFWGSGLLQRLLGVGVGFEVL
jgi:hypothetical protein